MRVQELLGRTLARIVTAADARDRDVLVERLMLLPRRRLDRGDDLTSDAQLGERTEAGLVLGTEVAGRLVQPDQRLLLDVVGVAADEEVPTALGPGEAAVPGDQRFEREAIAGLKSGRKFIIGQVVERGGCHVCSPAAAAVS